MKIYREKKVYLSNAELSTLLNLLDRELCVLEELAFDYEKQGLELPELYAIQFSEYSALECILDKAYKKKKKVGYLNV